MNTTLLTRPIRQLALAGLMAGLIGGSAVFGQGEDEWYDPSDWFDGNNIEAIDADGVYELEYDFGDAYGYGTDWSPYGTWDPDSYDADFWGDDEWYDSIDLIDDDAAVRTYTYTIYTAPAGGQQQASTGSGQQSGSSSQQAGQPTGRQQDQAGQPTGRQQSGSSKMSQGQTGQSVAKLNGTIEGLRQIRLERESGATGSYTLANIKLENGENTIVNLGRSSQLEDANLKKGDSIQALGRKGMIDGKTVFVAHHLKAGGKTIDANPAIRLSKSHTTQKQQKQKTITGTVADVSTSTQGAGQQTRTLLNLQLENGQSATVDLGPAASLEKIDLEEGETVTVRGYTKQMNGREVLVPNLLKVEGEKVASVSK